jgi:hypothetical protein
MRRGTRSGWIRVLGVVVGWACVLSTAGAAEPRLVVEIDEPFLLQGRVCPAGTVSLRQVSRYNPASTLHEIRVGGESLGVFLADRVVRDGGDGEDTIRFERNRHGDLVLLGYTVHRSGTTEFFRFAASPNTPPELIAQGPIARSNRHP